MTWSVVAVDSRTGEVGVAVASCVPLDVVLDVPGVVVGRGALVTQSYLLEGARDHAVALLGDGLAPDTVLARLVDPSFDPDFELRQIAIVDVDGRVASFTGQGAIAFAGHASSRRDGVTVAVQGNLLTGPEVLASALDAALDPSSCDVPARLLAALEAGGSDGRGDARCTPLGRSSQSATLRSGDFVLEVGEAEPGAGLEPLAALRAQFDDSRVGLPCPVSVASAAMASASAAGGGDAPHVADPGEPSGCAIGGGAPGSEGAGAVALGCAFAWVVVARWQRRQRRSGTTTGPGVACSVSSMPHAEIHEVPHV